MSEKEFYKMLAEIHSEVSDMACGCMGSDYTAEKVRYADVASPVTKMPRDYIGNIIRKYIPIK